MRVVLSLALFLCVSVFPDTLEQKISKAYDLSGSRYSVSGGATRFKNYLQQGKAAEMATEAIQAVLIKGTDELRKRGYKKEAEEIMREWRYKYCTMVYEIRNSREVGDHPGVLWLLAVHEKIAAIIGEDICNALRIHDLWNFGMTIGVVFRCQDNVPMAEYFEHFVLFAGCTAYWIASIACTATCPVPFVCMFAGMGVEKLVTLFVVPKIQGKCFSMACEKGE